MGQHRVFGVLCTAFAVAVCTAGLTHAQVDSTWCGETGDWSNAGEWSTTDDSGSFLATYTADEIVLSSFSDIVPVPEPTTMGLLAIGGLAIIRRRRPFENP